MRKYSSFCSVCLFVSFFICFLFVWHRAKFVTANKNVIVFHSEKEAGFIKKLNKLSLADAEMKKNDLLFDDDNNNIIISKFVTFINHF